MGKRHWRKQLRQLLSQSLPVVEFYLDADSEPLFARGLSMPIPRVGDVIAWWYTDHNYVDHECRARVTQVEWGLWFDGRGCHRVTVQLELQSVDGRPPAAPESESE